MTSLAKVSGNMSERLYGCVYLLFNVHATRKCVFMVIVNNLVTLFSCFDGFIIIYTLLYTYDGEGSIFVVCIHFFPDRIPHFLFHN